VSGAKIEYKAPVPFVPVLAEDPSVGKELRASPRGEPRLLRAVLDSNAERQRQIAADLTPLLG
jgi:hypothetical protein